MDTPNKTPKRKRMDMNDETFDAEVTTHFEKKQTVNKKNKRFANQVMKVIDGEKVNGIYRSNFMATLPAANTNSWHTVERGDLGTVTDFFTPLQFKDAEGILFFNKVPTDATNNTNGWYIQANNNDKLANVRVKNSTVSMRFKSNSTMKMIVEIYEVQGESTLPTPNATFAAYWNLYSSQTFKVLASVGKYTGTNTVNLLTSTVGDVKSLLSDFKVKKTVMKFEPGEEATHFIQGPRNYLMNCANKINYDGTWQEWTYPGSGIRVMFRIISDLNMMYYKDGVAEPGGSEANINITGAPKFNPGHWPNSNTALAGGPGAVMCEISRYYNIEQPEGTNNLTSTNFQPAMMEYLNYAIMVQPTATIQSVVPGSGTVGADPTRD